MSVQGIIVWKKRMDITYCLARDQAHVDCLLVVEIEDVLTFMGPIYIYMKPECFTIKENISLFIVK